MPGYLWTGQTGCYDMNGTVVPCRNSGQDGEFQTGTPWPAQRFAVYGALVLDNLTGLQWLKNANPREFPITWQEALDYIAGMNREKVEGRTDWRLPNQFFDLNGSDRSDYWVDGAYMITPKLKLKYELHYRLFPGQFFLQKQTVDYPL
jgi:hypothetical protein